MKVKSILIVALLFILFAGSVFPQSSTVATIGGSYWRGAIKYKTVEYSDDYMTYQTKEESKAGNLFGPYVNLRFNKISLGGSWFFGSWDFGNEGKLKRSDLNLSLGLSLNSNLTLFGAYKILKLTTEYESETNEIWNVPYIGGGASITFPFPNSSIFLFGSGAYLTHAKDKRKVKGYNEYMEEVEYEVKVDDNITTFTVGVGYRLESGVSILVGFRGDVHKASDSSDDENLKINGLIATLAYTLQ